MKRRPGGFRAGRGHRLWTVRSGRWTTTAPRPPPGPPPEPAPPAPARGHHRPRCDHRRETGSADGGLPPRTDVVVVGAGLAGLAAARALTAAGLLVDRAGGLGRGGRAGTYRPGGRLPARPGLPGPQHLLPGGGAGARPRRPGPEALRTRRGGGRRRSSAPPRRPARQAVVGAVQRARADRHSGGQGPAARARRLRRAAARRPAARAPRPHHGRAPGRPRAVLAGRRAVPPPVPLRRAAGARAGHLEPVLRPGLAIVRARDGLRARGGDGGHPGPARGRAPPGHGPARRAGHRGRPGRRGARGQPAPRRAGRGRRHRPGDRRPAAARA